MPLGGHSANSSPFVARDFVYFQGTDNGLYRMQADGKGFAPINGHVTKASPFVTDKYIYFRGGDDHLYRVSA